QQNKKPMKEILLPNKKAPPPLNLPDPDPTISSTQAPDLCSLVNGHLEQPQVLILQRDLQRDLPQPGIGPKRSREAIANRLSHS
ncbi:hypothetical protein A2U01_0081986, partial [Trifolium medium]|nr:hypothetical protein [Trifolium medium]